MLPSRTSQVLLIAVILGSGLAGCGQPSLQAQDMAGAQTIVTPLPRPGAQGDPEAIVSAEAVVVPYKQADLSFRVPGVLQEVLVSEGELVTAGQELARLDIRDLEQAILQAEAGLKSAQAELAKAKAGARPEEVAAAQAAVAIAQAGAKAAEGTVQMVEGYVAAAQADWRAAGAAVQVAEGNLAATKAALSSAQASLDKLLAGPTDTEVQIAEKQVEQARNELWALQRQRDATRNVVEGQLAAAENAVEIAQLRLDELKAGARSEDLAMARAQVVEAQAAVQSAESQIAQAEAQVAQTQAGVQIAEGELVQAQAELARAQAQTSQAQAQLDLLNAGSRPEDVDVAEAAVVQAEVILTEASNALDDAVLKAPFDSTVGEILIDEGEQVSLQVPVMRLGQLTLLRVETDDLSEVDVDQVSVGQKAMVIVDALDGRAFEATVSRIAAVAVDRRGDKVYTVTLDLGVGPESGLRWGMSAFVDIEVR